MPKEKLNKFMKDRSGAAVTKAESDRLKKEISGAAISDAERERLQDAMPVDAIKNISGASVTDAERERFKNAISDYADGGEVVMGKGKDYIKDLL